VRHEPGRLERELESEDETAHIEIDFVDAHQRVDIVQLVVRIAPTDENGRGIDDVDPRAEFDADRRADVGELRRRVGARVGF